MSPDAGSGHAAHRVLARALGRPPRLGSARLVCVDGPSGSGKSTLAETVVRMARTSCQLVHVDELFPGWDGMPLIASALRRALLPVADGRDGWWRRWDWVRGRWAEWHRVSPGGLIVVEGVGSGDRSLASYVSTLVWVDASREVRLARGVERDDGMLEHWRRWQVGEDALFAREHTRERADLRLRT